MVVFCFWDTSYMLTSMQISRICPTNLVSSQTAHKEYLIEDHSFAMCKHIIISFVYGPGIWIFNILLMHATWGKMNSNTWLWTFMLVGIRFAMAYYPNLSMRWIVHLIRFVIKRMVEGGGTSGSRGSEALVRSTSDRRLHSMILYDVHK